jgi:uncharacterized protein YqjF (DUF2071 family)
MIVDHAIKNRWSADRVRWLIAQRWEQLLFAHWPVDPREARRLLPPSVEPDVYEGSAWLAIVAFRMVGSRPTIGPRFWHGLGPIPELNVRTYVRVGGVPGVWFVSLDTSSPLFVAFGRTLFGLRYRLARMTAVVEGETVHYCSAGKKAAFAASYAPAGAVECASPGSLEYFLVERYRLFAEHHGHLITAQVTHEPWPLQPATAEIAVNRVAPPGVAFRGDPLLHFSRSVSARISFPELVYVGPEHRTHEWATVQALESAHLGCEALVRPPRTCAGIEKTALPRVGVVVTEREPDEEPDARDRGGERERPLGRSRLDVG